MSSVIDEIREEGEQIGKQIGEQKTNLNAIKNVMESLGFTVEAAMDTLKIPGNERELYAALLRNES